eukprot:gene3182-3460_t
MLGWEPAFIDNHGAYWNSKGCYELVSGAACYEQYEISCAAKVGFGVAVQYCLDLGLEACWQRTQQLGAYLREQLASKVPGLQVQDKGRQLCGIVSFTLKCGASPMDVKAWLSSRTPPINVSVSGIGSTRLDFEARGLTEVVRASVSYLNTEEEVEMVVAALQELVNAWRAEAAAVDDNGGGQTGRGEEQDS